MKVLIATDGTECGLGAVNAVKRLNLNADDEIVIVNVVDMSPPFDFDGDSPSWSADDIETAFRHHAEKAIDSARKVVESFARERKAAVRSEILFGSPAKRIVEAAEEWEVDLIMVGSHGYSQWQRILLGSVSDSVVHHAHCTVMVVRSNECVDRSADNA